MSVNIGTATHMTAGVAVIGYIVAITTHPNADRLEILHIADGQPGEPEAEVKAFPYGRTIKLVSGKHYRVGDFGVWFKPGAVLHAKLASALWMPTNGGRFEVRDMQIRGIQSPGLWGGEWYRNDKAVPAVFNSEARNKGADRISQDGWLHWEMFRPEWKVGMSVDADLGVEIAT